MSDDGTPAAAFGKITGMLRDRGIAFSPVHHEATLTSEASAKARGEDLSIGAKAIVMKVDTTFRLFVVSAALRVDSKKIKNHFRAKSTRFATPEELLQLTGLVPGSVPPFGEPILNLPLHIDASVLRNQKVAFNAGSLTDSIIMRSDDYARVAQGDVFDFSREKDAG